MPVRTLAPSSSQAIDDYAKALYKLERGGESSPVPNSALAEALHVSPGAVTAMLKRMEELKLIAYRPYKGAKLTEAGRRVALEVMRHHRLIEAYLADALGMSWDRVHAEAEVLEHYISEELEELIADALGNPELDPHGDPIPSRDLRIDEQATIALGAVDPGGEGIFVRVSDSDPAMLRYLAERGIAPGDRFEVVERQPFGGPLSVRFGEVVHALGGKLLEAMRVRFPAPDPEAG